MFDTWLRTVLGDRTSCAVMSAFDRAGRDHVEDLALALGELGEGGGVGARGGALEVRHQPARDAGAEDRLARRHRPDGAQQLRAAGRP